MDKRERVLGAILGAAVGDAMGAATESKTPRMIQETFGGYVRDLLPGTDDTFVRGCPAGTVTDDFSLAYFTAQELACCGGDVTDALAKRALLAWAEHPEFYRYAGPTTRASVEALREAPKVSAVAMQGSNVAASDVRNSNDGIAVAQGSIDEASDVPGSNDGIAAVQGSVAETAAPQNLSFLACDNGKATNGSAMKIFPVGLINPGNLEKTVRDTVTICLPTHTADASIAGAAAIACAVAKAVTGASLDEVIQAGFFGVRRGMEAGARAGKPTSVASVEKRMELAISIAEKGGGWERVMLELGGVVGSGIAVNEAVPCVFGILQACGDDAMAAVEMGVNIGNDTDTVATMVGAIAGAMQGAAAFPERFLATIEQVNCMDLRGLAEKICTEYYG